MAAKVLVVTQGQPFDYAGSVVLSARRGLGPLGLGYP